MMKKYKNIDKVKWKKLAAEWMVIHMPEWLYVLLGRKFLECDMLRTFYHAAEYTVEKRKILKWEVLIEDAIPQFNFWVFNKVLGMIAYWDVKGGGYYNINITSKTEKFDIIKSFINIEDRDRCSLAKPKKYDLGDESIWSIDYFNIFDPIQRTIAYGLYKRYFHLTEDFNKYVNEDLKIISNKKVLGVLIRGTDYTKKKPAGHPVQPSKEQILSDIKRTVFAKKYKYIYLATDEENVEIYIKSQLWGQCEVLINRRMYFDSFFNDTTSKEVPYISSCRHDREDDCFLTSKEYLSSIVVLSKCNELMAGNCGGSRAAIYINGGKYEDVFLYDLGKY